MRSNKYDIVCVAQPSWDGPYAKSTVLLMKELAHRHRVLYVDYARTWKDLIVALLKLNFDQVFRMIGLKGRIQIITTDKRETRLAVLTLPPMLPLNFLSAGKLFDFFNRLNSWTAKISIRKAIQHLGFNNAVVINAFAPGLGLGLLHQLNERATFYYCYDEITQADWSNKHGGEMESNFAKKVDAVVVSSDALQKEKAPMNVRTAVVKNGVDITVFHSADNAFANSLPVIGFVGSLDSRIDYTLLGSLIAQCPDFHFQFVGRVVDHKFELLRQRPNVEWIPPVAYNELPHLVHHFDVGIIPFVKSEFTKKIYPLKINEYLAMGKPVVMTSFASLPEFSRLVDVADDAKAFQNAIVSVLENNNEEKVRQRKNFARQNSWAERAAEFVKVIDKVTSEKE